MVARGTCSFRDSSSMSTVLSPAACAPPPLLLLPTPPSPPPRLSRPPAPTSGTAPAPRSRARSASRSEYLPRNTQRTGTEQAQNRHRTDTEQAQNRHRTGTEQKAGTEQAQSGRGKHHAQSATHSAAADTTTCGARPRSLLRACKACSFVRTRSGLGRSNLEGQERGRPERLGQHLYGPAHDVGLRRRARAGVTRLV